MLGRLNFAKKRSTEINSKPKIMFLGGVPSGLLKMILLSQ